MWSGSMGTAIRFRWHCNQEQDPFHQFPRATLEYSIQKPTKKGHGETTGFGTRGRGDDKARGRMDNRYRDKRVIQEQGHGETTGPGTRGGYRARDKGKLQGQGQGETTGPGTRLDYRARDKGGLQDQGRIILVRYTVCIRW